MNDNTAYEEVYKGYKINIKYDYDYQIDDQDENRFLVGYHRQFTVNFKDTTKDELQEYFETGKHSLSKTHWIFPLSAYIHSGVALSLSRDSYPFNDRFDSCYLGGVFLAKKEWKTRAKALKSALSYIDYWNQVLSGQVYGYVIEDEEGFSQFDSCWGYVGDYDTKGGLIDECKAIIDGYIKDEKEIVASCLN